MVDVATGKEQLLRAMEARDPDAFERALEFAYEVGLSRELARLLADALLMPWHARHEDLALALQTLRDPLTVDAIFEAALSKHDYLAYDDSLALARKCTWALADIGTAEARKRLEQLASGANSTIAAVRALEERAVPHRRTQSSPRFQRSRKHRSSTSASEGTRDHVWTIDGHHGKSRRRTTSVRATSSMRDSPRELSSRSTWGSRTRRSSRSSSRQRLSLVLPA
jgi:hypothetical protein